jgi:hypothetical protein
MENLWKWWELTAIASPARCTFLFVSVCFPPHLSRAHGLFDPAQEIKGFCGFKEDRLAAVAAKPLSGWRCRSRRRMRRQRG